jgi:hypothetical protein
VSADMQQVTGTRHLARRAEKFDVDADGDFLL